MTYDRNSALYAFEKFGDTVLRAAFACCGSYAEAEDITQDVFLMLHSSPQSFESDEHIKAWLLRVTINKCKNYKRSFRVSRTQSIDENADALGTYSEDFHGSELREIISKLPKKYSSVIFLYYYEGYSTVEIGKILGKSPNTAATLLRRGRERLKNELTKEDIIYET